MQKPITQYLSLLVPVLALLFLGSCRSGKSAFDPNRRYSPQQLQRDYSVYRNLLEESHPGLYWYTSKDSMNYYFNWGERQLQDSLTEPQFRRILSYVSSQINCGHTSIRNSRSFSRYLDSAAIWRIFPLSMKIWNDTMVVTANLHRRDSQLTRGTIVTAINGMPAHQLIDTLSRYISADGYSRIHREQSLSNRGFLGSLYSSVFGFSRQYKVDYLDSMGVAHSATVPIYYPALDTAMRNAIRASGRTNLPRPDRKEIRARQLSNTRILKIDTLSRTAYMNLASFGKGYRLKTFFRRSFRTLDQREIPYLIIDVRSNGGGDVTNSISLSRYLAEQRFKVADSLYAIRKHKTYSRYVQNDFFNRLFITFFASRKKDGRYHFRYFEKHYFRPRRSHHYDGQVYILTGGNSFSATTLFVGSVIEQNNVTVVGEETGGGAYGNTAWLIPDVTLPETGVRFRLPLFRLVVDKNIPKNGRGIQPEVYSGPSPEAVRLGSDYKLDTALDLIRQDKEKNKPR